ncbi:NCS2 family permease [Thermoflavimicrobium dichotomicum]|uniref:Putative MFS transporter, AGZA family, xanthine/uracil permease n=1 Tax=Thermoflavimicrobium dichotomicum TaxID=46223 RepID=A0A1I3U255_9BACL|nr:NCS2 family permease [Thermoflavimicrobium dichotomicum]SFJ75966.1 putative MFS transporter, AGZA family, xanthine/uracil permease [Thermoflavimicrobium dichotomicum]
MTNNNIELQTAMEATKAPWYEKLFKIQERNSSVRTEIIAGLTTFMTISYILFVNPKSLSDAGIPLEAAIGATAFVIILGSLLYGLLANLPIAVGPGVGLNAFFAYTVVLGMGLPWQTALGAVFISGVLFLILTVTNIRKIIIEAIPPAIRYSVGVGVGAFLCFIGMKSAGIVIPDKATFVKMGSVTSPSVILAFIGLILAAVLIAKNVKGSFIISILVVSILAMIFGVSPAPKKLTDVISLQIPDVSSTFLALDIPAAIAYGVFSVIFSFTIIDLLDNSATLVALAQKAGLIDKKGKIPHMQKAFYSDSVAIMGSAVLGSTATNAYSDNAAGIASGGRTGLTAVVVAVLCAVSVLFFMPLIKLIPSAATAPILILVGAFMLEEVKHLKFDDFTDTLPAFLTIISMPLTFSIANGLGLGFISYSLLKILSGKYKEVHWMVHVISIAFIISFLYHG